jgi:hypothetical protein
VLFRAAFWIFNTSQRVPDRRRLLERRREADGVLHRELRARAHREMRRVRRVAHQHNVAVVPAGVVDPLERDPLPPPRVSLVAHERVSVEPLREQPFAEPNALLGRGRIEACSAPDVLRRLDDERARLGVELIGVHLKPAPRRLGK